MKAVLFVSATTIFVIGCFAGSAKLIVLGIILGFLTILEVFQTKKERERHHFNNNHKKSGFFDWDAVDEAFYDDNTNKN